MHTKANLTLEEKINMIFNYLFEGKSQQEEEDFWNKLTEEEANELEVIKKQKPVCTLEEFKQSL